MKGYSRSQKKSVLFCSRSTRHCSSRMPEPSGKTRCGRHSRRHSHQRSSAFRMYRTSLSAAPHERPLLNTEMRPHRKKCATSDCVTRHPDSTTSRQEIGLAPLGHQVVQRHFEGDSRDPHGIPAMTSSSQVYRMSSPPGFPMWLRLPLASRSLLTPQRATMKLSSIGKIESSMPLINKSLQLR
jgi:hypothetical protein